MWIDFLCLPGRCSFGIGTFVEWLSTSSCIAGPPARSTRFITRKNRPARRVPRLLSRLPFMIGCWLIAWLLLDIPGFGIGMIAGGSFYAAFAAYAHQVQHERPELTIWMRRPVHYIHHVHSMWHHNYGISFDLWDRVFGTYKYVEWRPARPVRLLDFFRIHWYYYKPTTDEAKPFADAPPSPESAEVERKLA